MSGVREELKRPNWDILAASPSPPVNRTMLCTVGYVALPVPVGVGQYPVSEGCVQPRSLSEAVKGFSQVGEEHSHPSRMPIVPVSWDYVISFDFK